MCIERGHRSRQAGVSLVELIVFIVVVSVGVVGLLSVTGSLVRFSPDPMVRKQMMAIAESLLTEVLSQPFTYCDPADANALSATSTADCTGGAAGSQDNITGPTPAGATRLAGTFNNVADYATYAQSPVTDVTATYVMNGYGANVAIARAGTAFGAAPDGAALQVSVTISRAGLDDYTLTGYRFRYAPRN